MKSLIKQELQEIEQIAQESSNKASDDVLEFRKRMLEWSNPVEYVNNMYGCHPGDDDDDNEYFKVIYQK